MRSAAFAALVLAFALPAAAQEEVPFITSPDNVTQEMLRIAGVKQTDYVLDLGSGDGRIVITAARQFGARGMGVEIVPDLVARSNDNARRAGVADRARFVEQDLFKTDLTQASVITMYLLPEVNLQLRPQILALRPGTRIVSHDWDMGDWKPDRTSVLEVPDKKVGLEKRSRVHLWVVPAPVDGLWCGRGPMRGARLELLQQFQEFRGELRRRDRSLPVEGRIEGAMLRPLRLAAAQITFRYDNGVLSVASGPTDPQGVLQGAAFERATGPECPA